METISQGTFRLLVTVLHFPKDAPQPACSVIYAAHLLVCKSSVQALPLSVANMKICPLSMHLDNHACSEKQECACLSDD